MNLARSLIHDPPVILLDEPTRGLDVLGSKVIFDYIAAARQAGKAVIVCTHRLGRSRADVRSFGLLHRGRIMHEGTLAELQQRTGLTTLTEMFLAGLAGQDQRRSRRPHEPASDFVVRACRRRRT